jgi:uncharacterized protein
MSSIRFTPPLDAAPGHEVILLPERAVYWPARRTLMVADLHLGKSQTFWAAGAPVPDGVLDADLARLDHLLRRTEATRLIVLGDLLHAPVGVTPILIDRVAAWRNRPPAAAAELIVVPGNHDRAIEEVAAPWRLSLADPPFDDAPFAFRHEPLATPGAYTWAGHIHPQVLLASARDSVRLPCFWLGPQVGVLPSFSAFTRGQTIRPADGDAVYTVADGHVVPI